MEIIVHRVNTINELKNLPHEYGIELDIRDYGERLILQHDPFKIGEDFEEYLKHYQHGTMILNIKSERIEHRVLELINKYNIRNYFFLDSSFPMIFLLSKCGESNIAIRYSEFEGIDTVLSMKEKVKWVWIDCFTKIPLDKRIYRILKEANLKLCIVSPELQGREKDIEVYKNYFKTKDIKIDAVCTKINCTNKWTDQPN